MIVNIREIDSRDAKAFLSLQLQLDNDNKFMLFEPNEREVTFEQQKSRINKFSELRNSTIFIAEIDEKLIGYLMVIGGNTNRIRHRAELVIGIVEEYKGQGIGTRLFNELENWRKTTSIDRFELTVMVHNDRALSLYKKMGFEVEGVKKKSLIVDGNFVDEYYMAKTY